MQSKFHKTDSVSSIDSIKSRFSFSNVRNALTKAIKFDELEEPPKVKHHKTFQEIRGTLSLNELLKTKSTMHTFKQMNIMRLKSVDSADFDNVKSITKSNSCDSLATIFAEMINFKRKTQYKAVLQKQQAAQQEHELSREQQLRRQLL